MCPIPGNPKQLNRPVNLLVQAICGVGIVFGNAIANTLNVCVGPARYGISLHGLPPSSTSLNSQLKGFVAIESPVLLDALFTLGEKIVEFAGFEIAELFLLF